jgi:hypothetical protein
MLTCWKALWRKPRFGRDLSAQSALLDCSRNLTRTNHVCRPEAVRAGNGRVKGEETQQDRLARQ